jgi:hypothetical protein
MSGHVVEPVQKCAVGNVKVTAKALYVRKKPQGPHSPDLSLFKVNIKRRGKGGGFPLTQRL